MDQATFDTRAALYVDVVSRLPFGRAFRARFAGVSPVTGIRFNVGDPCRMIDGLGCVPDADMGTERLSIRQGDTVARVLDRCNLPTVERAKAWATRADVRIVATVNAQGKATPYAADAQGRFGRSGWGGHVEPMTDKQIAARMNAATLLVAWPK